MSFAKNIVIHYFSQTRHCFIEPVEGDPGAPPKPADESLYDAAGWLFNLLYADCRPLEQVSARRAAFAHGLAEEATRYLRRLDAEGAELITFGDESYPPLLRSINDPPAALCILGRREALRLPAVAIVGARKATYESIRLSGDSGKCLAERGFLVVSGGAYGCDIAAHRGALASRGPGAACVVFAGGLGQRYPRRHEQDFRAVLVGGGVLASEKLWSHAPRKFDFPIRNRIVAGMCASVIVVQAASSSGTLVTARAALDQGREVLVCAPPSWDDVRFGGNIALFTDGASEWASRSPATMAELPCGISQ